LSYRGEIISLLSYNIFLKKTTPAA